MIPLLDALHRKIAFTVSCLRLSRLRTFTVSWCTCCCLLCLALSIARLSRHRASSTLRHAHRTLESTALMIIDVHRTLKSTAIMISDVGHLKVLQIWSLMYIGHLEVLSCTYSHWLTWLHRFEFCISANYLVDYKAEIRLLIQKVWWSCLVCHGVWFCCCSQEYGTVVWCGKKCKTMIDWKSMVLLCSAGRNVTL